VEAIAQFESHSRRALPEGLKKLQPGPYNFDSRISRRCLSRASIVVFILLQSASLAMAADLPVKAPPAATTFDWTGAYVGGHLGYAWGQSNWNSSNGAVGSLNIAQPIDVFSEAGSFFGGFQAGYDKMFANRFLVGVVGDVSFPAWPNLAGISIGGSSNLVSPLGPDTYTDNMLAFGTLRARVGYAPGNWLFYATGGVAWSYNQLSLASAVETPMLFRLGWAAGAGVEVPVASGWTANLEYLYTQYNLGTVNFASVGQTYSSNYEMQEVRFGLNYHFGDGTAPTQNAGAMISPDMVSFHGQGTFVWQGYPTFKSPYAGAYSLPGTGTGYQTTDVTLFSGIKLWEGAEFWLNTEIDQGFGVGNTHGVAGFPSAESYKLGDGYPYARISRAFVRQTINLGGETEKVDDDINQFAGSHSTDRIVLTVGRFGGNDIFDTNKYSNNPKVDFLNWSLINTGTFDYPNDAWGYTFGAAAEWYVGHWTVRAGIFDLTETPASGNSPFAFIPDPTFKQFGTIGEIERRYELWGQPGTIKVTGFLNRGSAGTYTDAVALAQATGQPIDITAVRHYTNRPGLSMNLAQQITDSIGVFMRAGWSDGNVEPWDFTDINRTVAAGTSISGKLWGRPDDIVGIAGVVNSASGALASYLQAGGTGILIGDGQLPNPKSEQIFETYYSYAANSWLRVSLDYQHIANPGYNADRGPVNLVALRAHTQF
jgi:high affinity Mn2+ porin